MSEENLLGPSRWGQLRADMGGWLLAARRALRATKGGPPSVLEDIRIGLFVWLSTAFGHWEEDPSASLDGYGIPKTRFRI